MLQFVTTSLMLAHYETAVRDLDDFIDFVAETGGH